MKVIKKQFPIFKHHKNLVYLDNASTTQTPQAVLDAMNFYYEQRRANIHRGVYQLSGLATQLYEESRDAIAEFLNAYDTEVIFTSGTTHSLNLLAYSICRNLKSGDNVVLTRMEHHANIVPWIELSKRFGFEIRYIELNSKFQLQTLKMPIDDSTKIVSMCYVSNTLGTINPVQEILSHAKNVGAVTILDAAQAVGHIPIDVKKIDCDFLVFSGHKMYGPTGIGVLYGKKNILETLEPFFYGGDMVKEVRYDMATWNDLPWKFEGGTPNISGAIGLAAAVRFLNSLGLNRVYEYEHELREYALKLLGERNRVHVIGPEFQGGPIISFIVDGIHPHDISQLLDHSGIALRAGHHCTMPLMQHLGLHGTSRVSFGVYNTKKDVDHLINGIDKLLSRF